MQTITNGFLTKLVIIRIIVNLPPSNSIEVLGFFLIQLSSMKEELTNLKPTLEVIIRA